MQKEKLLLIDNITPLRDKFVKNLRAAVEFDVRQLTGAEMTLDHLAEIESDKFAAVLIDFQHLALENTGKILNELAQQNPALPIIVFSLDHAVTAGLKKLQATRYLKGTSEQSHLINVLDNIAGQEHVFIEIVPAKDLSLWRALAAAWQQPDESFILEKLKAVGQMLTYGGAGSLQNLLTHAAEAACELTGADCSVIYPYDSFKKQFYIKEGVGAYGLQQLEFALTDKPREAGLAAFVRKVGYLVVHHVAQDDEHLDWQEPDLSLADKTMARERIKNAKFIARENIQAFAGISLVAGTSGPDEQDAPQEEVGVLYLNFRSPHHFTLKELTVIQILSHQIANAIYNVRLLDRERRLREQAETLRKISEAIGAKLELKDVAEQVLDEIARVIEYRKASIQIIHSDESREIVARRGFSEKEEKRQLLRPVSKDPLIQRVVGSKKPLILNDTSQDPDWDPQYAPDISAWVCFPLIYEEETTGLITLDHDEVEHFADIEADLLTLLSTQLANAIGKAWFHEKSQHRLGILNALQEISVEINRKRDLDQLIPTIMKYAVTLIAGQEHKGIEASYWQCDHAAQESTIKYSANPDFIGLKLKFGQGLLGRVIATGHADFINEYLKWESNVAPFNQIESAQSIKHLVDVPILIDGQVAAVLAISDTIGDRPFTVEDIELLEQFASLAAIAVENARLNTEAVQRIRDLSVTNEIIGAIQLQYDRNALFREVTKQVKHQFDCDQCTLFLWSADRQALVAAVALNSQVDRQFKPGEGIAGLVYSQGQSIIITDTSLDERFLRYHAENGDMARSMLTVPLKIGDQVIGVLSADKEQPNWFTINDQRLLETLMIQIGYAIQQIEAVDLIKGVNTSIAGEAKLDQLLQQLVQGAVALINVSSGVIHLLDDAALAIVRSVTFPKEFDHPAPRIHDKTGLTYQIVQDQEPKIIHRDEAAARFHPSLPEKVQSMIGIPLIVEQKVIGVLFLNDYDRREFTAVEQSLLETLVGQAAVAIQNAELLERLRTEREERIRTIKEIGFEMSEGLKPEEFFDRLLQKTLRLMHNAHAGEIWMLDKNINELNILADFLESGKRQIATVKVGEGIVGWVAKTKKPYLARNVAEHEALFIRDYAASQSELAVPLLRGQELIGVLNVEHQTVNAFDKNDVAVLEAVAGQVVVAIENARILEGIISIGQVLTKSVIDLNKVLVKIVQGAVNLSKCDIAAVLPYDEFHDEFILELATFHNEPKDFAFELRKPAFEGIVSRVLADQKLVVEDIDDTVRYPFFRNRPGAFLHKAGVKAFIGIRLSIDDKHRGVLFLDYLTPHKFSEKDLNIAQFIANQAATALETANLFEQLRQRAIRLAKLQEIATSIISESSGDLHVILQQVVQRIKDMFEASYCAIRLYNSKQDIFTERIAVWSGEKDPISGDPRPGGMSRSAIRAKRALYKYPGEILQSGSAALRSDVVKAKTQAFACLPLLTKDDAIGVIHLFIDRPYKFSEYDQQILELFAGQAATAIESTTSLNEIKELNLLLEQIQQITAEITSETTDRDTVLDQIVTSVSKTLQGVYCAIRLYDSAKQEFGKRFAFGAMQELDDRAPRAGGASDYVVKNNRALYASDINELIPDSDELIIRGELAEIGAQAAAYLPLNIKENIVGVLYIFWTTPQSFSGNEIRTLQLFADQTTIAIENARLFSELGRELEQAKAISDFGEMLAAIEQE